MHDHQRCGVIAIYLQILLMGTCRLWFVVCCCWHSQAAESTSSVFADLQDLSMDFVCIQCRLQTTPSLCQPRSSRRASLSSQQLLPRRAFSVAGPAIWNWLPDRLRPGHQKRLLQTFTEDVFIFSLLVYIAH